MFKSKVILIALPLSILVASCAPSASSSATKVDNDTYVPPRTSSAATPTTFQAPPRSLGKSDPPGVFKSITENSFAASVPYGKSFFSIDFLFNPTYAVNSFSLRRKPFDNENINVNNDLVIITSKSKVGSKAFDDPSELSTVWRMYIKNYRPCVLNLSIVLSDDISGHYITHLVEDIKIPQNKYGDSLKIDKAFNYKESNRYRYDLALIGYYDTECADD